MMPVIYMLFVNFLFVGLILFCCLFHSFYDFRAFLP